MRLILLFVLAFSFMYANTTIQLKKGWQLVGVPSVLKDMSGFDNIHVEILWGYDAQTQAWKGYAPDITLRDKMKEKNFDILSSLEPWQAAWVFSKEDWSFNFEETVIPQSAHNSVIKLYEGWNLVQIPQRSVVSDAFFGDAVVWKYSGKQEWLANDETLNFPSIETIAVSEGLWVKSETTRTINVNETLSKLRTFDDEASMLAYIRKMMEMNNNYYYPILEPALLPLNGTTADDDSIFSGSDSSSGDETTAQNTTTTNLQEEGVDESDILKHDGVHIFSADNSNGRIVVTSFEKIAQQDYQILSNINMNDKNVVAMYLQNNRLSVVSSKAYYYSVDVAEDIAASSSFYEPSQSFTLEIFNVSDINNITSIASYKLDGNYQDSRLIDGRLFLISQFSPNIQYEYPKVYENSVCSQLDQNEIYVICSAGDVAPCRPDSECAIVGQENCEYGSDYKEWYNNDCNQYNYDANGAWKHDYDNPIVVSENLIPSITTNGISSNLVAPSKFYAPNKLDQRANITSISSFNIEDGTRNETLSFLGNTHNYYASTSSLYLVSSEYPLYYDYLHYKEQQMIYKFSLGDNMAYVGRGFVDGWMLNQFSMSEKDDYLRVATTVGQTWWNSETINSVYTLKNVDETLEVKGQLNGLGHEGETIRAVRFMGNRGFVVTFRQTDPLYTLDLSNPEAPKIVGELSIPGFSTYLHVVDENRVLSIGRNADAQGRQLELQFQLFDITDFASPRLVDKIQIGNENTYSEAEYNHKAFSYRESDLMFGVPYRSYSYGENKDSSENFGIYQIDGMTINSLHTISSSGSDWGNVGRGLIFDLESSTYGALLKGSNIICETVK